MFRLLRTCPGLHGAEINFNASGSILYGSPLWTAQKSASYQRTPPLQPTCFRAFDASDYFEIGTRDVEHPMRNLAVDFTDRYLAITESRDVVERNVRGEVVVRLYEIGRRAHESDDADDGHSTGDHMDDDDEDASSLIDDAEYPTDEDDPGNMYFDDEDEDNFMQTQDF